MVIVQEIGIEPHCVVTPAEIVESLVAFKDRYVKTREKLKKVYGRQVERYKTEYDKYVRKELDGKLTPQDKAPTKPSLPQDMNSIYDRSIRLYETTSSTEVAIDYEDFCRYFFDDWSFIKQWKTHIRHTRAGGSSMMLMQADMADLDSISAMYGE